MPTVSSIPANMSKLLKIILRSVSLGHFVIFGARPFHAVITQRKIANKVPFNKSNRRPMDLHLKFKKKIMIKSNIISILHTIK